MSLTSLHQEFSNALKEHAYIDLITTSSGSKVLQKADKKGIRLLEVFNYAIRLINNDTDTQKATLSSDTIQQLTLLKQDGENFYLRYQKETNTWKRSFMKTLAWLTPTFFKKYLCACFSNTMSEAEQKTSEAYNSFNRQLVNLINPKHIQQPSPPQQKSQGKGQQQTQSQTQQDQTKSQNQSQPKGQQQTQSQPQQPSQTKPQGLQQLAESILDDGTDQNLTTVINPAITKTSMDFLPLPAVTSPTQTELDAKKKKEIDELSIKVESHLKNLKEFEQRPLSIRQFKQYLTDLALWTKKIISLDPAKNFGLSEADLKALSDLNETNWNPIQQTQWSTSFTTAEKQEGFITFGIKKFLGNTDLVLKTDKNTNMKDHDFKKYQGHVKFTLTDLNVYSVLDELIKIMKDNETCRPCTIEIQVKEKQTLTPELIEKLLVLNGYCSEVVVKDLEELDFTLCDPKNEHLLVQKLGQFSFPDFKNIVLSKNEKKDWTPQDYSSLLALHPTLENLKLYFTLCATPEEIVIPSQLTSLKKVDFKGMTPAHIAHLLTQFTEMTELDLSTCQVTDSDLGLWIAKGHFAKVSSLHLNECDKLTTDSLHYLMSLKHLVTLTLPDLTEGKEPLSKLPSFNDPFKINFYYTSSRATQKVANEKYTGHQIWASVFQIPLARKKADTIYPANTTVIDPKTAAFLLYQNDYKNLPPLESIRNVFADSCSYLNDDNIVEFMQKFPKAIALSLYNNPYVTNDGIIKLLRACPQLKTLNLTGCTQIDADLLLDEENIKILKNLNKITVGETGINPDVAQLFSEDQLKGKLECPYSCLKIADNDLNDDQALDTLLKGKKLNDLKRIDLTGCTKLTNAMLGQLLDRLDAPMFIKDKDGATFDNPQRLNLAVLNLTDCSNISEEAFDQSVGQDGKATQKLIRTVDRLVIGGTKIKMEVLQGLYPKKVIQEIDMPVAIAIDPNQQLLLCQSYFDTKDDATKKALAKEFIFNRIALKLFSPVCTNKDAVKEVCAQSFDVADEQFCDLICTFSTLDAKTFTSFPIHRDVLYTQSPYFHKGLVQGGVLSFEEGLDYINVHATPKAAQALIQLIYKKLDINSLDWETAANVAELIGPKNFKFPKITVDKLLERFRSQFAITRADKMLLRATRLEDQKGKEQFENDLFAILDAQKDSISAADLAFYSNLASKDAHHLPKLDKLVKGIEATLNIELRQQMAIEDRIKGGNLPKPQLSSGFQSLGANHPLVQQYSGKKG